MAVKELSRRQICARLGCSRAQIAHWEAQGKLHGRRERPTGYSLVWYSVEEVQKLAATWVPKRNKPHAHEFAMMSSPLRGKLAAQAFKMFRDNVSLADVVIALEIDPLLAHQFWNEYQLTFEQKRELVRERERAERDRIEQRRKDRADSLQAYREHQRELATMQAKATVEAAREAAKIAARRTG